MTDRRHLPDRRKAHRGGRRIADLAVHEDAFVTPQALADHLTVAKKTVMKWIESELLPAYRFGSHWRIRTRDAIAFVEHQRVKPTGGPTPSIPTRP